uniref:Protein big brother n=1 Tax=Timema genevievae TaxID=629358 RepID=A0A7R9PM39_TIMGE|nr:unnamed protein product [Timema genevievae]
MTLPGSLSGESIGVLSQWSRDVEDFLLLSRVLADWHGSSTRGWRGKWACPIQPAPPSEDKSQLYSPAGASSSSPVCLFVLVPAVFASVAMHAMNDPAALAGMLPFDSIGLYEQPKPRFIFKMPRVVPDQKSKFESDELFRRLSRESEVRYTGYRDRPQEERQVRFQNGCREGHTEIAFVATGTNIQLVFNPSTNGYSTADPGRECDFDKEHGKL